MLRADQGARPRSDVGPLFVPSFFEEHCELSHEMLAKVKDGERWVKNVERLGEVSEKGGDRSGKGEVDIETIVR